MLHSHVFVFFLSLFHPNSSHPTLSPRTFSCLSLTTGSNLSPPPDKQHWQALSSRFLRHIVRHKLICHSSPVLMWRMTHRSAHKHTPTNCNTNWDSRVWSREDGRRAFGKVDSLFCKESSINRPDKREREIWEALKDTTCILRTLRLTDARRGMSMGSDGCASKSRSFVTLKLPEIYNSNYVRQLQLWRRISSGC